MTTISPEIMEILEKELPAFFTRRMAVEKLHGIFTYQTLSNYEHRKIGPPVHYMGRVACYTKEDFIKWMYEYFGSMQVEYKGMTRQVRRGEKQDAEPDNSSE